MGIGIARGQYYWILDIGCLVWYCSNPNVEVDFVPLYSTMLGQPPATAVMSTSLAHHQQTALQQHEDMAAAAAAGDLDSYEVFFLYQFV